MGGRGNLCRPPARSLFPSGSTVAQPGVPGGCGATLQGALKAPPEWVRGPAAKAPMSRRDSRGQYAERTVEERMDVADEKKRMGPSEFLLLRGWERYVLEEVATEYRRKREANEELWLLADNGIRFRYPRLGISGMNMNEALGLELGKAAKDLGGFERLVEVLDAARAAGGPEQAPGYGGNGKRGRP